MGTEEKETQFILSQTGGGGGVKYGTTGMMAEASHNLHTLRL